MEKRQKQKGHAVLSASSRDESRSPSAAEPASTPIPVVGIASSLGQLESSVQMLSQIPSDTGMAFVVVPRFSPTHTSPAPILANRCSLPVSEVTEPTPIRGNQVYVVSPNTTLRMHGETLVPVPMGSSRAASAPIDFFFHSLADSKGNAAVGIILSSGGEDGILGLQALKAAGGITFGLDPHSATFSEMAENAAGAEHVDFILPPAQIADELIRISRAAYLSTPEGTGPRDANEEEGFRRIHSLLFKACRVSFSEYKQPPIERRVRRRMLLHKTESIADYASLLEKDQDELAALYADLLIKVSSFFRDRRVFEAIQRDVFPAMLAKLKPEDPIRVWVPGCSSGQEVYSLLICLLEVLPVTSKRPIQFFGTDLSEKAIETARIGRYPLSICEDVSLGRLRRFFTREDDAYKINKSLREMCVFAKQNLIADPPFSRLDMISCRNLLIYFGSGLQERVMQLFHYALNPEGILVLGSPETIASSSKYFSLTDRANRIQVRREIRAPHLSALWNGILKQNHLGQTRPKLALVPSILEGAKQKEAPARNSAVSRRKSDPADTRRGGGPARVARLEKDLAETREKLRVIQRQCKAVHEEFRLSSEETLSNNEELQCANEELETSHEELRATNEELVRVNAELKTLNGQLDTALRDIEDLFTGLRIPVVMLRKDFTIRRFTPVAQTLFKLIPNDVGRSFFDIRHNLRLESLEGLLTEVIQKGSSRELEVKDNRDCWYCLRVEPYLSQARKVDGATLILLDIHTPKKAEIRFRALLESAPDALIIFDGSGKIVLVNALTEKLFGYRRDQLIGRPIEYLVPEPLRPRYSAYRKNYTAKPSPLQMGANLRTLQGLRSDGSEFPADISLSPIEMDDGCLLCVAVRDATGRIKSSEELGGEIAELARSNQELERFAAIVSHDLKQPMQTVSMFCELLAKRYGDQLDGSALRLLDLAQKGSTRMARLVDGLMKYARVGNRLPILAPLDIRETVQQAVDNLFSLVQQSGAKIETKSLPKLIGDPITLAEVFQNLIGNGIKYGKSASPPLISISAVEHPTEWEFLVRDNGMGIEAKHLEEIFVIFRRLDSRPEVEGTGVGLAICKKIVEAHKGRIWVESIPGEGSTFHLTISRLLTASP